MLLRAAVTALLLLPMSASAAAFFSVGAGQSFDVQSNNNFKSNLANLELLKLKKYSDKRSIALVGRGRVTFFLHGSESGFRNGFKIGSFVFPETDSNWVANPILFHSGIYTAATFNASFVTLSGSNVIPVTGDGVPGTGLGFGIFSTKAAQDDAFTAKTVYFGFDDRTGHPDKDFDDMIVSATVSAVPEPSIWGAMILGFGLVGGALRRRSARMAPPRFGAA